MPKTSVDGPSYAGHVDVSSPDTVTPEWAPAVDVEPVVEPAPVAEPAPKREPAPVRRPTPRKASR